MDKSTKIQKNYILCRVGKDGTTTPQGDTKRYRYALSILKEYKMIVPDQDWRLFKLVEVKR